MTSHHGPGQDHRPGPLGVLALVVACVLVLGVILWAYGAIP